MISRRKTLKKSSRALSLVLALWLGCSSLTTMAAEFTADGADGGASSGTAGMEVAGGTAYIARYGVEGTNDWVYEEGKPAERHSLTFTVVDDRLQGLELSDATLTATPHNGTFTASPVTISAGTGEMYITFTDVSYLGGDPTFSFDISYWLPWDSLPSMTLSQTIGQCRTVTPPTPTPVPEPTETPTWRTPTLILRNFSYGENASVAAGQECTLSLSISTTSGNEALDDVLVSLSLPDGVSLVSGSQSAYIGTMQAENTQNISFRLQPGASFTDGIATIGVNLSGVGAQSNTAASGSGSAAIPVTQPERFEITKLEAPESIMAGEESYVSLTYVNKGKTSINNLSAEITGTNFTNPGQAQYLGNVAAGTESSVEFSVTPEQAGMVQGTILLNYETDNGDTRTLQKEFSCTVEEAMQSDPNFGEGEMYMPEEEMPVSSGFGIWPWVLLAVVAGVVAFVVIRRRKRKKTHKYLITDDDEDELV